MLSMFDSKCTFPLRSDLFAQAIHPKSAILALGLASGHVQLNRLPPSKDSSDLTTGHGTIDTVWRTRRHKGSCRSLFFSHDGEHLFSAGTDGLVKVAATETGQVASKLAVPLNNGKIDSSTLIHIISPQTLLLATDSSALHLYDLRENSTFSSAKPSQTHYPHSDYISSLTPLPPGDASVSGFSKQWVSTGGTTVAVTDLRRGVLVKSEDQGEEMLSSTVINGKVIVGGEKGVLRMWEVGVWDDNENTIAVGSRAGADVLAAVPEDIGSEPMLAVGMDDGFVRFVGMGGKRPKVIGEVRHDEVEGVISLGFESGGRMISGGGAVVKVWEESVALEASEEENEGEGVSAANGKRLNGYGSGEESSDDAADDSSEEEEKPRKRKKRKRSKGNKPAGEPGIVGFKGMD